VKQPSADHTAAKLYLATAVLSHILSPIPLKQLAREPDVAWIATFKHLHERTQSSFVQQLFDIGFTLPVNFRVVFCLAKKAAVSLSVEKEGRAARKSSQSCASLKSSHFLERCVLRLSI
jgi:hypothetical protein